MAGHDGSKDSRWVGGCLVGLSLSFACVAQNPLFSDTAGADGSGTSGAGTRGPLSSSSGAGEASGLVTTIVTTTAATAGTTNDDVSGAPTSVAGTTQTGVQSTEGSSTDDRPEGSSTGESTHLVLVAAAPTTGEFGQVRMPAEVGLGVCTETVDTHLATLDCADIIPIVAHPLHPFSAIASEYPILEGHPFVDSDFVQVASTWAQLITGEVDGDFADRVTANLGSPVNPTFWWGPAGGPGANCQSWGSVAGSGRTLTFDSSGGAPTASVAETPCSLVNHLLCACVVEP